MSGGVVPWSVTSLVEQRLEFCLAAEKGAVPFVELARRYGISAKTGYKWLARYRVDGIEGLEDRSRRPLASPGRTPGWVEDMVVELRLQHPAWGGRKIHHRLVNLGVDPGVVPAASTVTDILRRHDLLAPPGPSAGGYQRFEEPTPNGMWQMDFKGWLTTGEGRVDPFDILDDHSRYSLCLKVADQEELTVRSLLETTFRTYGMPNRILCDNGSPWGNTQPGHRWTSLGVWLIDLNIDLVHSRVRHPQTLGKDERFHRTLDLEVISTRTHWQTHQQLQDAFDQWRPIYNHQRPHDALDGAVPADRYQPSTRSMPTTINPYQYPDTHTIRKVSQHGQISYRSNLYRVGKAFRNRPVSIHQTTDTTITVHYRHQQIRTIELTQ